MQTANEQVLNERAAILKALAHPTRLWMVERLSQGELCVCEFVAGAGVDFSTVSKHLTVLRQAGIVSARKLGKQVFYTLEVPCILGFMNCVDAVIQKRVSEHSKILSCL